MEIKGTAHAPILITSNADFASQASANGWPGNGTQENPYIIEGYEINVNGGTYCIWIENTNVWFVIRNCILWNATSGTSEPWGTGIYLKNVTYGTLINNNCSYNSHYGIYLYSSSNNNITNNNCSYNSRGISMYSSSNNNITNNNCSYNSDGSIYLGDSSNYNIIMSNNCSYNSYYGVGIYIGYSNYNTIMNSNCSYNSFFGMELYSSDNNNITNNNCFYNSYFGISVGLSLDNTITNNNIYQNEKYGVYIYSGSTGNTIHHNNFWQNNGAWKGVSGSCQAYDDAGYNYWYDNTAHEGNYWSNWDGNDWGTASAYPIDGGKASDWYPLGSPTPELSPLAVIVCALGLLCVAMLRKRK